MEAVRLKQDLALETAKAAPAVGGAVYSAFTLNEWVAVMTIIYIVLQAAVLVHKHICYIKDRKNVTLGQVKDKLNELSD